MNSQETYTLKLNLNFCSHIECEHLIRHMLVRDPSKRFGIKQIKEHKWMKLLELIEDSSNDPCTEEIYKEEEHTFNDKVLQQMANIGISREKALQVNLPTILISDHPTKI